MSDSPANDGCVGHVVRRLKSGQALRVEAGAHVVDVILYKIAGDWIRLGVIAPREWRVRHLKSHPAAAEII